MAPASPLKKALAAALILFPATGAAQEPKPPPPTTVIVVAPSVSTSMEARRVLQQLKWVRTDSYKQADAILVVVRSVLFNPLSYSYSSVCDLLADAESQLNIAGLNFHVYVYQLNDDLSVNQIGHESYPANP